MPRRETVPIRRKRPNWNDVTEPSAGVYVGKSAPFPGFEGKGMKNPRGEDVYGSAQGSTSGKAAMASGGSTKRSGQPKQPKGSTYGSGAYGGSSGSSGGSGGGSSSGGNRPDRGSSGRRRCYWIWYDDNGDGKPDRREQVCPPGRGGSGGIPPMG